MPTLPGPTVINAGSGGFVPFSSYLVASTVDESGIASGGTADLFLTVTESAGSDFSLDATPNIVNIANDCWAIVWMNYNVSADTGVFTTEGFQFTGTSGLLGQFWDHNFLAAAGDNFLSQVVGTMPTPFAATDQIFMSLSMQTSAGTWTSHGSDPAFAVFRVI